MEEKKCGPECPECARKMEEEKTQEEMNLAVLITLVPMLAMTLFSQVGIL